MTAQHDTYGWLSCSVDIFHENWRQNNYWCASWSQDTKRMYAPQETDKWFYADEVFHHVPVNYTFVIVAWPGNAEALTMTGLRARSGVNNVILEDSDVVVRQGYVKKHQNIAVGGNLDIFIEKPSMSAADEGATIFEVSAYPMDNITEFDIEYMFSTGVPGLRIYRDGIIVHDDGYVMANGALSSGFIKTYSVRESSLPGGVTQPPAPMAPPPSPPAPSPPPRPPPQPSPPPSPPPIPSPACAATHGDTLGQCAIYPSDDGLWSDPPPEFIPSAGTVYKADALLRGLEKYDDVKMDRHTYTDGSTTRNPYDGYYWQAYSPEYLKLNGRLRAFWKDGTSAPVKVEIVEDTAGDVDVGPLGIYNATLRRNVVTMYHQKMPWTVWFRTLWAPKDKSEEFVTPYTFKNSHCCLKSYAVSMSQTYPLGGVSTYSFSDMFPTKITESGGCVAFLTNNDVYVRMQGYEEYSSLNGNAYETQGWGSNVKIQIDNIDDACQGKGYIMETSSMLRAEIDMTSVFESSARVTLSVRSNALYWLMSYGQKSSGAVASWSHSQRRQSDFTAQYLLQYGSTYRFYFYALLKPCVDIVQSYTTATEVPQCLSQGNSTEAMDVANGYMTQAMYLERLFFDDIVVTSALLTPPPPPAPSDSTPRPPPMLNPPPLPPVYEPVGMSARLDLWKTNSTSGYDRLTVTVTANTWKTHLWGWAFDLNINSGQLRTDEEDPKKYIDVTALTWRYGAHASTWFEKISWEVTGGKLTLLCATAPTMTLLEKDVYFPPFGNEIPLVEIGLHVKPGQNYQLGLNEGHVGEMLNVGLNSFAPAWPANKILFLNNFHVVDEVRYETITASPPPPSPHPPSLPSPPPIPPASPTPPASPPPPPDNCDADQGIPLTAIPNIPLIIDYPGPGYTEYKANAHCKWRISGTPGAIVHIQMVKLDIVPKGGGHVDGDSLVFGGEDGMFAITVANLVELAALSWTDENTFDIVIPSESAAWRKKGQLEIEFHSDASLSGSGFRLLATVQPTSPPPLPPPPPPSPPPPPPPTSPVSSPGASYPYCKSCTMKDGILWGVMDATLWAGSWKAAYNWNCVELSNVVQYQRSPSSICYFEAISFACNCPWQAALPPAAPPAPPAPTCDECIMEREYTSKYYVDETSDFVAKAKWPTLSGEDSEFEKCYEPFTVGAQIQTRVVKSHLPDECWDENAVKSTYMTYYCGERLCEPYEIPSPRYCVCPHSLSSPPPMPPLPPSPPPPITTCTSTCELTDWGSPYEFVVGKYLVLDGQICIDTYGSPSDSYGTPWVDTWIPQIVKDAAYYSALVGNTICRPVTTTEWSTSYANVAREDWPEPTSTPCNCF